MIAALPMYDRAETRAAHDRFWNLIARSLARRAISATPELSRGVDVWDLWQNPELVVAQTCGLPYRARLHGHVTLVATPIYDLRCRDGYYFSSVLARTPQLPTSPVLAVNDELSQSGWAAAYDWITAQGIDVANVVLTGSHQASAEAVAKGRADFATLDALTWKMVQQWDGFAGGLVEIDRTEPTPTLPYISALDADADLFADALGEAVEDLAEMDRKTLMIKGFTQIPADDYLRLPVPPKVELYQ